MSSTLHPSPEATPALACAAQSGAAQIECHALSCDTRWGLLSARVCGRLTRDSHQSDPNDGARPLALLLHGGHGSWQHWQSNLPLLSEYLDLVVPDLPGFGQSCDLPQDSTLNDMAVGLHDALRARFGRAPDLIVGFSFGALLAAVMADMTQAARPAVVLINPPLGQDVSPEVIDMLEQAAAKVRRGGLAAGIEHSLRNIMLSDQRLVTPELLEQASTQARQARFASRRLSRVTDFRPLMVPLAGRCDLLLGGRDPHHRASLAERLPQYQRILGADRVHVLSQAAHWLQRDCPDDFDHIVRAVAAGLRQNKS